MVSIGTRVEGGKLTVMVGDDGPGLLEPLLRKMGHSSVTSKAEGTGFGLYGIAQLLEARGGHLVAANEPGGAAVIELSLRLSERISGAAPAPPSWASARCERCGCRSDSSCRR